MSGPMKKQLFFVIVNEIIFLWKVIQLSLACSCLLFERFMTWTGQPIFFQWFPLNNCYTSVVRSLIKNHWMFYYSIVRLWEVLVKLWSFTNCQIHSLIHLFARDVLVMKKLEIKKTKPTFNISVLKVEC